MWAIRANERASSLSRHGMKRIIVIHIAQVTLCKLRSLTGGNDFFSRILCYSIKVSQQLHISAEKNARKMNRNIVVGWPYIPDRVLLNGVPQRNEVPGC